MDENVIISIPGNQQKYTELWAILSSDANGNEGIMASPYPAVSGTEEGIQRHIDAMNRYGLIKTARQHGYTIELVKFNVKQVVRRLG